MEIYGKILDAAGNPIAGASIQRMYPTGENYSSVVISATDGSFNGRVPDRSYFWVVSKPGYLSLPVNLANALHDRPDLPFNVHLETDPSVGIEEEVFTSEEYAAMQENNNAPAWLWILGGATVGAVGLWYLGSPRTKVKLRKILK